MGRLLAFRLVTLGWKATLFDRGGRDGKSSCSWIGAGMLTPWAELEKAEPIIAELGVRSLELWPGILADLDHPVFFQKQGSIVVAHRQDYGDMEAFKSQVRRKLTDPGLMRELDRHALTALEPELADRFGRGVFFPGEGQLEPHDLLPALERWLAARDVAWHTATEVRATEPHRIHTETGEHSFDLVIDTRGLGAEADLPELRGVRGELIRLEAPEVRISRPVRLMHPRYPLYIVPRPGNTYVIGATSIESRDMRSITVKSSLELLSAAYSLHPGFAEANILETSVHCRPAFPDNLPRVVEEPGLTLVNGLYRHGFLIAPALVERVCDPYDKSPVLSEVQHAT